jgi:protocatechuate 3,4-dioxygenase alpha subunit
MTLLPTGSQTVGPYFHIGFTHLNKNDLAPEGTPGVRIKICGKILDGNGAPIDDAVLEIWQADASGNFAHAPASDNHEAKQRFRGFGRIPTDKNGRFELTTIKPGRTPGPAESMQAPHISVTLFMRGLLKPLYIRMYFPDEPSNADDIILNSVDAPRRATLILRPVTDEENSFEWNVVVQGVGETVFFEI